MTHVATALCLIGIIALFILDRDRSARPSVALWIPIAWLLIAGSRPVSQWLAQAGWADAAVSFDAPSQYLEGSPIDRAIFTGLLVAGLLVLFGRANAVLAILRLNWPILLFISYCAVSIVWSDYPDVAFKRWIKSLGDYVMVLIILSDRCRLAALKQVLARVGFVLLPLSVLVIKYYPDLGRSYGRWEGKQFFLGIAQDKNMLGMTCLIFGLAATWRFLSEIAGARRAKPLIVHGTIFLMALWLFWMANSMTSLSVFLLTAGLIFATTFFRFARRPVIVHAMVLVVIACCFSALFLDMGGGALKALGRDPTLTGRTEIWGQLVKVPVNPLVGTGFESFWLGKRLEKLWSLPGMQVNEAHNGFLETYLNLGVVGVILMLLILIPGYRNIVRSLSRDPEVGRLKLGYFVAAVVYSLTEAAFRMMGSVWIFLIWTVMEVPSRRALKKKLEPIEGDRAQSSEAGELLSKDEVLARHSH